MNSARRRPRTRWLVPAVLCLHLLPGRLVAASIQEMIDAAADGGVVTIAGGVYTESIVVDKNLTLRGAAGETAIVQGPTNQRVVTVTAGHDLHLEHLTIGNGHPASGVGGGVWVQGGSLFVSGCSIENNGATYGGGIYQAGSTAMLVMSDSFVSGNTSANHGGGIYAEGNATVTDSHLLFNTAAGHGGGVHVQAGDLVLSGGTLVANVAGSFNGGAVNVNNGLTVSSTLFRLNSAGQRGGAVLQWNPGQPVVLSDAVFDQNTAGLEGGALWTRGDVSVAGGVFTANMANSASTSNTRGGALFADGAVLTFAGARFEGNAARCNGCASSDGGAVRIGSTTAATIVDSAFADNEAWIGAAVNSAGVALLVERTTFTGNHGGYGGGVYATTATIRDSGFVTNDVVNAGAALWVVGPLHLERTRLIDNTSGSSAVRTDGSFDGSNVLCLGNQSGTGAAVFDLAGSATRSLVHITIDHPTTGSTPAIVLGGGTLALKNSILTAYAAGVRVTGGTLDEDFNLFFANTTADVQAAGGTVQAGGHSLVADPLFLDPVLLDDHLTWGSPAIGLGTDVGVTVDLDGAARVGRFDAGCYQYQNRAPVVGPVADTTVAEGSHLDFVLTAVDPEGTALTWSSSPLPAGATFDAVTGRFAWTPGYDQAGTYPLTFTVTDGGLPAQASMVALTITVADENRAVIIAPVEDRTVVEGGTVAFVLTAVDPDGTATTWSSPQLPAGAALDPVSGAFTWTPRYDQAGTYPLIFTATDGGIPSRSSSVTVTVHVGDPDGPICSEAFDVPGDLSIDPAWAVLAGTWRVTPRRMLVSAPKTDALARLSVFTPDGFPFVAGIVSARLKLTAASRHGPNVALVFSLRDGANYRYVRLQRGRVVIGERGRVGSAAGAAEVATRARPLSVGRWHDIAVHLHPDGLVEVYRGGKRLASHRFPEAAPGGLGLATLTAKALVDDVTVEDEVVLP